jgi:hypothetical protein
MMMENADFQAKDVDGSFWILWSLDEKKKRWICVVLMKHWKFSDLSNAFERCRQKMLDGKGWRSYASMRKMKRNF